MDFQDHSLKAPFPYIDKIFQEGCLTGNYVGKLREISSSTSEPSSVPHE